MSNNEDHRHNGLFAPLLFDANGSLGHWRKAGAVVSGELATAGEEYRLIQQMNEATAQRYADMASVSANVARSLQVPSQLFSHLLVSS